MKQELLNEILIELFGTETKGEATEDGFLIKLREGDYDKEQFDRLYYLFKKVNNELDPVAAGTMAYYTEFITQVLEYLYDTENPEYMEVSADLVGMWGRKQ